MFLNVQKEFQGNWLVTLSLASIFSILILSLSYYLIREKYQIYDNLLPWNEKKTVNSKNREFFNQNDYIIPLKNSDNDIQKQAEFSHDCPSVYKSCDGFLSVPIPDNVLFANCKK